MADATHTKLGERGGVSHPESRELDHKSGRKKEATIIIRFTWSSPRGVAGYTEAQA
jgi:hypothetical protein